MLTVVPIRGGPACSRSCCSSSTRDEMDARLPLKVATARGSFRHSSPTMTQEERGAGTPAPTGTLRTDRAIGGRAAILAAKLDRTGEDYPALVVAIVAFALEEEAVRNLQSGLSRTARGNPKESIMAARTERDTLNGLIEMCRDAARGFQMAADHVGDPELKRLFEEAASQRDLLRRSCCRLRSGSAAEPMQAARRLASSIAAGCWSGRPCRPSTSGWFSAKRYAAKRRRSTPIPTRSAASCRQTRGRLWSIRTREFASCDASSASSRCHAPEHQTDSRGSTAVVASRLGGGVGRGSAPSHYNPPQRCGAVTPCRFVRRHSIEWQLSQSCLMLKPSRVLWLSSWQRKQPFDVVCPLWLG